MSNLLLTILLIAVGLINILLCAHKIISNRVKNKVLRGHAKEGARVFKATQIESGEKSRISIEISCFESFRDHSMTLFITAWGKSGENNYFDFPARIRYGFVEGMLMLVLKELKLQLEISLVPSGSLSTYLVDSLPFIEPKVSIPELTPLAVENWVREFESDLKVILESGGGNQ